MFEEKIVEDKAGLSNLRKEMIDKKNITKKKHFNKVEKAVLIPIRDTPV
jgi:hypothetical protein